MASAAHNGTAPVRVEQFARVFVKGVEQIPTGADAYVDDERGYYYKLHLDRVTADEATPLIKAANTRFGVELVYRVRQGDIYKERVYIDSPEEAPEGFKVHTGPQGGLYYETGVQQVAGPEGQSRSVAVITWDDTELGDQIVFETPEGEETFAEIIHIDENGGEPDRIYVEVDGDRYEAVPGTYSVDKSAPTVWKAADDPWVPYEGPRGGSGWMNRRTGEVLYQDEHPGRAEGTDDEGRVDPDPELDFDPSEPPDGGYARGWEGPPDDVEDLLAGQAVEFFDDGYGYAEVVGVGDGTVEVETQAGEHREVSSDQITARETDDWDPTDTPDVPFGEVGPGRFAEGVSAMIEEEPEMGAFLTEHDPEEFEDYELIMSDDGLAGAAVSPDGDIQNVFARADAERGAGRAALAEAIEAGGITLDCYDGYLRDLYTEFGFRETGRMEFNPEYAPEGFDFDKYGHPDVVFMHFDPEVKSKSRRTTMSQNNGETQKRTPEEQRILDRMAERRGEEFVAENEELILTQARQIGDL